MCRSSLQQCRCVIKSSSDVKSGSDPVFDDLSDDLTGKICLLGIVMQLYLVHILYFCIHSVTLLCLFNVVDNGNVGTVWRNLIKCLYIL